MDRSLWLLMSLRARGWLRRVSRSLRTVKGLLLALAGCALFLPMFGSAFLPKFLTATVVPEVRRHGPLALAAYCLLNVFMASSGRMLYYSPAEIDFLFSGPYRPRTVLLYKIVSGSCLMAGTAVFTTLMTAAFSPRLASTFLGFLLSLELLYLLTVGVGLLLGLVGALAVTTASRVSLAVAFAFSVWVVVHAAGQVHGTDLWSVVKEVEQWPAVDLILAPFRPFIYTMTATKLWPELVVWSSVATAIDLALLAVILGLNDSYLEGLAQSSARVYAQMQALKRGEVAAWRAKPSARGARIPDFPWCQGIGPNAWRQATNASRSGLRVLSALVVALSPVLPIVFTAAPTAQGQVFAFLTIPVMMLVFLAPTMLGFDFHVDVDRMDVLKTLPIRPWALVTGQIATPVALITLTGWAALGIVGATVGAEPRIIGAIACMIPPAVALIVAIENLLFLLYPVHTTALNSLDFQALGRTTVFLAFKFLILLLVGGLAGVVGLLAYLAGGHLGLALAITWLVMAAAGLGMIPLLAWAFVRFDVTSDSPG